MNSSANLVWYQSSTPSLTFEEYLGTYVYKSSSGKSAVCIPCAGAVSAAVAEDLEAALRKHFVKNHPAREGDHWCTVCVKSFGSVRSEELIGNHEKTGKHAKACTSHRVCVTCGTVNPRPDHDATHQVVESDTLIGKATAKTSYPSTKEAVLVLQMAKVAQGAGSSRSAESHLPCARHYSAEILAQSLDGELRAGTHPCKVCAVAGVRKPGMTLNFTVEVQEGPKKQLKQIITKNEMKILMSDHGLSDLAFLYHFKGGMAEFSANAEELKEALTTIGGFDKVPAWLIGESEAAHKLPEEPKEALAASASDDEDEVGEV